MAAKISPDYRVELFSIFQYPVHGIVPALRLSFHVKRHGPGHSSTFTRDFEVTENIFLRLENPAPLCLVNTNRGNTEKFTLTVTTPGGELGSIDWAVTPEGVSFSPAQNCRKVFSLAPSYPVSFTGGIPKGTVRFEFTGFGRVEIQLNCCLLSEATIL